MPQVRIVSVPCIVASEDRHCKRRSAIHFLCVLGMVVLVGGSSASSVINTISRLILGCAQSQSDRSGSACFTESARVNKPNSLSENLGWRRGAAAARRPTWQLGAHCVHERVRRQGCSLDYHHDLPITIRRWYVSYNSCYLRRRSNCGVICCTRTPHSVSFHPKHRSLHPFRTRLTALDSMTRLPTVHGVLQRR